MIITAYRIAKKQYARAMWSGIGAREYGGRWNSKGVAVVYTAQSKSLAALEQLVHLVKPRILNGFVVSSITFDERRTSRIEPNELLAGWDKPVAPASLRKIGDDWVAAGRYPILMVPSAIVPGEWNYLFNPAHAEFVKMVKSPPRPFAYDRRLG